MFALEQNFLDFLDFNILTNYFSLYLFYVTNLSVFLLPSYLNLLLNILCGIGEVLSVFFKLVFVLSKCLFCLLKFLLFHNNILFESFCLLILVIYRDLRGQDLT